MRGKSQKTVNRISFTRLKISVKTKMEDNTPVVTESYESQCRDTAVYKALFRISDCQYSNAKNRQNFHRECFYN